MRSSLMALAFGVWAAVPAMAGVHPPEIGSKLAFLVGDWTVAGADATYSDNCQWLDAQSFVVCDTRDSRRGSAHHSIAVLGWSAAQRHFTYQQYDDSGRSRTEPCYANSQKGITCLGERQDSSGLIQTRSHIWPTASGLGIRQEKSVNAGPWSDVGEVAYIRRKR